MLGEKPGEINILIEISAIVLFKIKNNIKIKLIISWNSTKIYYFNLYFKLFGHEKQIILIDFLI